MDETRRTVTRLAQLHAHGHVVDALAHDDLETTGLILSSVGLILSSVESSEWLAALIVVREERDRLAALLAPEQVSSVVRDVRDWSRT